MLRLQAPSSSNARGRGRHSAALSPAAALLLIHGVSGSIADNDGDAYRRRLFESEVTTRSSTINDEATIDWVAFAAETNATANRSDSTSVSVAATSTVRPSAAQRTLLALNTVGNDGSPSQFYPLGLCQGDCDNDNECAGNLICHQRGRNDAVPGCAEGRNEGEPTDFCILPNTAAPSMDKSPPVRLRLYWTRDSKWQDSTRETYWCLQCRSGSCKKNSIIEVDWCSRSKRQKFQYYEGDKTIRPMTNPSLCFEENGWNSDSNPIKLKRCNGSSRQRWRGFKEKRGSPFEFKSGRNSKYCMTQHHHPKAHERVYPQRCERARSSMTSEWVVF